MTIYDVFNLYYIRDFPIPFEKFQEIGWTENKFVKYLSICEKIRAAGILLDDYFKNNSPHFSDILKNSIDRYYENLTNLILEDDVKPNENYRIDAQFVVANIKMFGFSDFDKYLYLDSDSFRCFIEYAISRTINQKPMVLFDENEITLDDLNSDLIYFLLKQAEFQNYNDDEKPNFNSYSELLKWHIRRNEYNLLYLTSDTSQCENILEKRIAECRELIKEKMESSVFSFKDHILYVHKGNIVCQRNSHSIICVQAKIPTTDDTFVTLNANFCCDCKRFFVNYYEYQQCMKLNHALIGKFQFTKSGNYYDGFNIRNPESLLKLCGYDVSQATGLTTKGRQKILQSIMTNGILKKHELINYLILFITANGKRTGNEIACQKWEDDLTFVRNYNMVRQPISYIKEIKKYGK